MDGTVGRDAPLETKRLLGLMVTFKYIVKLKVPWISPIREKRVIYVQ